MCVEYVIIMHEKDMGVMYLFNKGFGIEKICIVELDLCYINCYKNFMIKDILLV